MVGEGVEDQLPMSHMHTPDSFYDGLHANEMPNSIIPADFMSSLDSEQTFHSAFFGLSPIGGRSPQDGAGDVSSSSQCGQQYHHKGHISHVGMDLPGIGPIGDASCTITLRTSIPAIKEEPGECTGIKTEPGLLHLNSGNFLDPAILLPPLENLLGNDLPSWNLQLGSLDLENDAAFANLPCPDDEKLLQALSANLDQQGQLDISGDYSQLSTIFEEAFPDLSEDMLEDRAEFYDYTAVADEEPYQPSQQMPTVDLAPLDPTAMYQFSSGLSEDGEEKGPQHGPFKKRRSAYKPYTSQSQMEAQRAKTRETARKLRQRKLETVQQLHQDVLDLTKENRGLVDKLKSSISVLDQITTQNNSLKCLLRCLHISDCEPQSPRLQKLMKLKKELESQSMVCKEPSPAKTLDLSLEDIPLVSQVGKDKSIDHFTMPCSADVIQNSLSGRPLDICFTAHAPMMG